MKWLVLLLTSLAVAVAAYLGKGHNHFPTPRRDLPLRVACEDTLIQLATACSEDFQSRSRQLIEVKWSGSKLAIEGLIQGNVDAALTTRRMTNDERERLKQSTGQEPCELHFGYFAMAVIVAKDSPLQSVNFWDLREIFAEGGSLNQWEQFGVGGLTGTIEQVARISPSGTRPLLLDSILGEDPVGKKRGVKPRMPYVSGSRELVELVAKKPSAFGYIGAAWVSGKVKALPIAHTGEAQPIALSPESVRSLRYPLSGGLYFITAGHPGDREVKRLSQWMIEERAQEILKQNGVVPLVDQ